MTGPTAQKLNTPEPSFRGTEGKGVFTFSRGGAFSRTKKSGPLPRLLPVRAERLVPV